MDDRGDDNAEQNSLGPFVDNLNLVGERPRLKLITPPSVADKARRLVWNLVWSLLARWTPVPLHGWRCALARIFGARLGNEVALYPSASIWAPWNLHMGDRSCLAEGVRCYNVDTVRIAENAVISQYSYLCTVSHDPHDPDFPLIGASITIGQGAWIAAEAFVSPGITVGDRAVAAARAVVVRNIANDVIVGGNPAKPLGKRSGPEARVS